MASLLVESDEKRRKTSEEEDGIRTLKELPDALLVFVMDFLRGDFKCWASLLGTCKYVHSHHVDNLVELKILWEKAQRKRALYNCYFYSTINLGCNYIRRHGNQRLRRSSIYEAEKQQQLLQGSYRFEGYRRTVPVVSIQRPIRLKENSPYHFEN